MFSDKRSVVFFIFLFFYSFHSISLAADIIIGPNTVINTDTTYSNATLQMTNGSFIVRNNATLKIEKCIINGTLSPVNPNLIVIENGNIILKTTTINMNAINIDPRPTEQSLNYVMRILKGSVNLQGNDFKSNTPFVIGLLITNSDQLIQGTKIQANTIEGFHGSVYLLNTNNTLVKSNRLSKNSFGNIVLQGKNAQILQNIIMFSGNNNVGNAIDVIDSENMVINENKILTSSCYSIYILNSQGININKNYILGGVTYGITILSQASLTITDDYLAQILGRRYRMKHINAADITITNNYIAQNRFGLTAADVNGLIVKDNIFSQRFTNSASRMYWTNNAVLLNNIANLVWNNNRYKEAFTQNIAGDNSQSMSFEIFPVSGGVIL